MQRFLPLSLMLFSVGCGSKSALYVDVGEDGEPSGTTTSTGEPGDEIVALAAGWSHTCALHAGGAVSCWGFGAGEGNPPEDSAVPVKVTGLPGTTVAIGGGAGLSCAVSDGFEVRCWGFDSAGIVTGQSGYLPDPVPVAGLAGGVKAVALGELHACAVLQTGTLQCWGNNASGALGIGTVTDEILPPTTVPGLEDVVSVAAGVNHTCAVLASGELYCWGNNSHGELGVGSSSPWEPSPKQVNSWDGIVTVAAGWDHTCAVEVAGVVLCWGSNLRGQLADGTQQDYPYPKAVPDLPAAVDVSCGLDHVCAVLADGTARCWGSNIRGEAGNGESDDFAETSPQVVLGVAGAKTLTAGDSHACAALAGGGVKCWGENSAGQLGNGILGPEEQESVPVDVKGW